MENLFVFLDFILPPFQYEIKEKIQNFHFLGMMILHYISKKHIMQRAFNDASCKRKTRLQLSQNNYKISK